jgi:hypothetical protein
MVTKAGVPMLTLLSERCFEMLHCTVTTQAGEVIGDPVVFHNSSSFGIFMRFDSFKDI